MTNMFGEIEPDDRGAFKEFKDLTSDYLFGEIWSREGLGLRERSLVTVTILVATGKEVQLKVHLKGAIANGLTVDELKEAMIHAAHYAGWPSTMNGLKVLQDFVDDNGLEFSDSE